MHHKMVVLSIFRSCEQHFNSKFLSENMSMHIPDPDEFESSISVLLDSVDTTSILYNISRSGPGKSSQNDILLPAPLYYQYSYEEWWSINSKQRYDSLIPWYRQSRNWPIYPILNDILVIELRKRVKIVNYSWFHLL